MVWEVFSLSQIVHQNDDSLLMVLGRPEVIFGVGERCCLQPADLQPECPDAAAAKDGNCPNDLNTNFMIFMIASRSTCI